MGGGKRDYSEAARDAQEFGAPAEVLATLDAGQADADFEVWAENWDTLSAFLAVQTQWRAIARGMDGQVYWQGLDYAGVEAGLRGNGIDATPDIWAGLRVMEAAARNALNGIVETD